MADASYPGSTVPAAQPVIGGTPPSGPTAPGVSSQAIAALILGILSLICCGFFTGIPAIVIGRKEMRAIQEGRSAAAGESVAKIGYILGLIGTVLTCLAMLAYALLFGLGIGAGMLEEMRKAAAIVAH